jgi:hypothetical protein
MAKKRKAATRKRSVQKRTTKRGRAGPDQTVNALVILVVIVIVLGGLYFYAQNRKQAALFPSLQPAIAAILAPFSAAFTPVPQPAATTQPASSAPVLQPAAAPQPTSLPTPEPAAVSEPPHPVASISPR